MYVYASWTDENICCLELIYNLLYIILPSLRFGKIKIGDTIYAKDLKLPKGIELLDSPEKIIISIQEITFIPEEVEEAVESPFTSYKKPREIESRGGSGIKQGTRYGGGKQKDVPTQDEAPKTKKPKGMMNFKEMFGE